MLFVSPSSKVRKPSLSDQVRLALLRLRKMFFSAKTAQARNGARLGVFPSVELRHVLPTESLNSIVDVGANRGQFALLALHTYPQAEISCFEPGEAAFETLVELAAGESRLEVNQLALSDRTGEAELLVAANDDSSSLLFPTATQLESAPGSAIAHRERVQQSRADEALRGADLPSPSLLKIDVQGAELQVLGGFGERLDEIDMVLVELSLVELYDGQESASSIISWLDDKGFELSAISPVTRANGQQLQFDALFRRTQPVEQSPAGAGVRGSAGQA